MKDEIKTIVVRPEITLCNPEDYFNDLIKDGVSVHDALVTIMEDEIVHTVLKRDYPNWDVRDDGMDITEEFQETKYTIRLLKRTDVYEPVGEA